MDCVFLTYWNNSNETSKHMRSWSYPLKYFRRTHVQARVAFWTVRDLLVVVLDTHAELMPPNATRIFWRRVAIYVSPRVLLARRASALWESLERVPTALLGRCDSFLPLLLRTLMRYTWNFPRRNPATAFRRARHGWRCRNALRNDLHGKVTWEETWRCKKGWRCYARTKMATDNRPTINYKMMLWQSKFNRKFGLPVKVKLGRRLQNMHLCSKSERSLGSVDSKLNITNDKNDFE